MRVNVLAVVLLTVGCASMDSGVPFSNDESQEIPTSSHSFIPYEEEIHIYDLEDVETTVTYGVGEYQTSDNFEKTDKYTIEEYGFFQITAEGLHDGQDRCCHEELPPQPWDQDGEIYRADLNGDGWQSYLLVSQLFVLLQLEMPSNPSPYLIKFILKSPKWLAPNTG